MHVYLVHSMPGCPWLVVGRGLISGSRGLVLLLYGGCTWYGIIRFIMVCW